MSTGGNASHAEFAASILRPYVREEVTWVIEHHGVFQTYSFAHHLDGDRNSRDEFAGHRWYDLCAAFCAEWDQNSFNPDDPLDPLDSFVGEVHDVFGRTAWHADVVTAGAARLVS